MTARVDATFERIARRLSTLSLVAGDDADSDVDGGARFVRTYSADGIRHVFAEYGLADKLRAQGLADYDVVVTEEDAFRHRLEVRLPDGTAPDAHVMDMRLHLTRMGLGDAGERVDVVVVEWLLMQNPRLAFTKERPRLPGQRFRGTGLGREVAQLLVLMCRRIQRDGLVVVPERFHLAELYASAGWRAPGPEAERDLEDVLAATSQLSYAARAWAVERGFVVDEHGAPYVYTPAERVLAVSEKLEHALAPGGFLWLQRLLQPRRKYVVDVDAFRESLAKDAVEGMDPDAINV